MRATRGETAGRRMSAGAVFRPQQVADTLADSRALGIEMDDGHDEASTFALARRFRLSSTLSCAFGVPLLVRA